MSNPGPFSPSSSTGGRAAVEIWRLPIRFRCCPSSAELVARSAALRQPCQLRSRVAAARGMQVVPVEEPPAPGLEAGDEEGVIAEQPSASEGREGGRGSVEFIGRYRDKHDDRAMPHKMRGDVRVAFGKLDELVQNGVSSGILAIRGQVSWSAGPDDTSYQRTRLRGDGV